MKCNQKVYLSTVLCIFFLVALAGNSLAAWGNKEIETEKTAIHFANEVMKGGYKLISTEELKKWLDQKKNMLIVDTMPYEDSYKKEHVPGAVQFEFPKEELASLDDKTKSQLLVVSFPQGAISPGSSASIRGSSDMTGKKTSKVVPLAI